MSKPAMPDSVAIDGIKYMVRFGSPKPPEGVPVAADYTEDGEFDVRDQTILIRPDLAPDYQAYIFIHESLHGMWEHAGLTAVGRPPPTEEEVVTAMAWRLLEFLRSNPEAISYLTGRP